MLMFPQTVAFLVSLLMQTRGCQAASNEGRRFALALPPVYTSVYGELILNAREDTTVILSFPFFVNVDVFVEAGRTFYYQLDHELLRCTNGLEDKGVMITAANPITVHLANADYTSSRNPDNTIVRPLPLEPEDVFLVGTSYGASSTSNSYRPKSLYMIVSIFADTEVLVFRKGEDGHFLEHNVTLGRNQVFTEDASYHSSSGTVDFTGSYVQASNPVAVFSGHGTARIPYDDVSDTYSRSLFESMPYFDDLGTEYITAPYHFGARDVGYFIRVVSVVNGTNVVVLATGYNEVLDAGEFYEFDFPLSRLATPISCSEPCIVAQYAKQADAGDSPGQRHIRSFMLILNSADQYSTDVTFATPSWADHDTNLLNALSIITDFYPVEDLYLDGFNLRDLDWAAAPLQTGWYATLSLDSGRHEMWTDAQEHRFTSYYHASYHTSSSYTMSFGYAVAVGSGSGNASHWTQQTLS